MSAKHTQGPWFRDDRSGLECDVRASSGRKVALCWGLASNNATNYKPAYRAECDANARLIAAAPELLDLLVLALPYVEEGEEFNASYKRNLSKDIRKAIAKFTGEV